MPTYRAVFTGSRSNVPLARRAIATFASLCGFSASEVDDIRLAAGEALNNAVEHGQAQRSSGFSVRCVFADDELSIEVRDNGQGFAFDGVIGEAPTTLRDRGFGIYLMRRLMDAVRFDRDGTCVRLTRRRESNLLL